MELSLSIATATHTQPQIAIGKTASPPRAPFAAKRTPFESSRLVVPHTKNWARYARAQAVIRDCLVSPAASIIHPPASILRIQFNSILESRPGDENRLGELMSIGSKRSGCVNRLGSQRFAVYWFLRGIDCDFDVCWFTVAYPSNPNADKQYVPCQMT